MAFTVRPAVALVSWCALTAPAAAQVDRITPALMARHIGVLADDSMRGRFTPSPQLEQSAAYVASCFEEAGLQPAGVQGYQQRFPVAGDTTAPNVVAVLPGSDPGLRGQYVVLVAHLDHVGVGAPQHGDSIYNGADDNASGTSGVLAVALALAGTPPRRSVLFLVTSGEERGIRGSRWFVAHPTVPFDSITALVNLDMIGRNRPDSVYLNGWGKSSISTLVRQLAAEHAELGLGVGPDAEDRPLTPPDSDHWPFQRRGVPYVFFYTGEHADYHRVSDEPGRIDADKAARVARLAYYTVRALADDQRRAAWETEARRLNVLEAR